jgi:hypothetical protein
VDAQSRVVAITIHPITRILVSNAGVLSHVDATNTQSAAPWRRRCKVSKLREKIMNLVGDNGATCGQIADAVLSLIRAEVEKLERHEMFEEDPAPDYVKLSDVLALLGGKI